MRIERVEKDELGLGMAGTVTFVPSDLHETYGSTPLSGLLFLHVLR